MDEGERDRRMERGTRSAWQALAIGLILLLALLFSINLTGVRDDPERGLLIALLTGTAYFVAIGNLGRFWRYSVALLKPDGFLAPRRNIVRALQSRPAKLVRWTDIARIGRPSAEHGVLAVQTTNGWVHYIHYENTPESYEALIEKREAKSWLPGPDKGLRGNEKSQ